MQNLPYGLSLLLIIVTVFLSGCHPRMGYNYDQVMKMKINQLAPTAEQDLAPYFNEKHVHYPPQQLAFLIFKNEEIMEMYARQEGPWSYIRSYPILANSGTYGPKLLSGDHQIPEGIYHLTEFNPMSRYDLSMHLDYPNNWDRKFAAIDHRKNLGSDICMHGKCSSVGCIALGDAAIEDLFPLVYSVGLKNVDLIIAPNDFRREKPIYTHYHPRWLPQLYDQIRAQLEQYPLENSV